MALVNEVSALVVLCARVRLEYTLPESTMDRDDPAFVDDLKAVLKAMIERILGDNAHQLRNEIRSDVLGTFVAASKELAKLIGKGPATTDKKELDRVLASIANLAVIIRGVLLGESRYAEYRAKS